MYKYFLKFLLLYFFVHLLSAYYSSKHRRQEISHHVPGNFATMHILFSCSVDYFTCRVQWRSTRDFSLSRNTYSLKIYFENARNQKPVTHLPPSSLYYSSAPQRPAKYFIIIFVSGLEEKLSNKSDVMISCLAYLYTYK